MLTEAAATSAATTGPNANTVNVAGVLDQKSQLFLLLRNGAAITTDISAGVTYQGLLHAELFLLAELESEVCTGVAGGNSRILFVI